MARSLLDLRSFLDRLRQRGDLATIDAPVACDLEAAEIHRRVIAAGGPALLFTNLDGRGGRAVTNLFGRADRVELAFGRGPAEFVQRLAALPHELIPPSPARLWRQRDLLGRMRRWGLRRTRRAPVKEVATRPPRATEMPLLRTWERDGGAFITLPLVYTEHPDGPAAGAPNLGMYRMQRYDDAHFGMHWQIGKGGGYHYQVAEGRGVGLDVNVFLGGPPALILAAVAPLPENVPELMLASLLADERLPLTRADGLALPMVASCEYVLAGRVPPRERRPEGPFGDHYGYYSLQHDYPVFHVDTIFSRRDAILPATVVGKPRQEDFYIGDYLQELLSPIFPLVMPNVRDLWSYGETGYHSLSAAVVKQRYKREAMAAAFRILGEGQLSLTKFLLVLDEAHDLKNFPSTLEHVLARCDFRTDLYVFSNLSMDTLDYTGPEVNEGSKGVLLGVGDPIRELPREFASALPPRVRRAEVFCAGCLVLEAEPGTDKTDDLNRIVGDPRVTDWPLLVLVDDAAQAVRSPFNFLWVTFTRFEPAADIHAAGLDVVRQHISYQPPILIDARLSPGFPDELFCDESTAARVKTRWKEYFPDGGVEMGDSDRAHLD
jgi:UbiD family decarboxylase